MLKGAIYDTVYIKLNYTYTFKKETSFVSIIFLYICFSVVLPEDGCCWGWQMY